MNLMKGEEQTTLRMLHMPSKRIFNSSMPILLPIYKSLFFSSEKQDIHLKPFCKPNIFLNNSTRKQHNVLTYK